MKRLLFLLIVLVLSINSMAQGPASFNYQAVIRDVSGRVLANKQVEIEIDILHGNANGTIVYSEMWNVQTNEIGLVNLEIGLGDSASFAQINWTYGPYFIGINVDGELLGTSQLLSVPYALHAKTAETVKGGISESDPKYSKSEAANITAGDITNVGNLSGTNTGDQDLSSLASKTALGDSTAQVRGEIPDVSGLLSTESDPVYSGSEAANITAGDITNLGNLSGTNTGDQDLSSLASKTALGDSTAQVRSEIPDVSGFLTAEVDGSVSNELIDSLKYSSTDNYLRVFEGGDSTPDSVKISGISGDSTFVWVKTDTLFLDHDTMTHYNYNNLGDGMALQKIDLEIINSGGLKLELEAEGGGDVLFQIDGKEYTLDCTTGSGTGGKAQIALTPGTDANTLMDNWIYVTPGTNGVAVLHAETTFPATSFAWIGFIVLADETTYASTGPHIFQRFTETIAHGGRGHLLTKEKNLG